MSMMLVIINQTIAYTTSVQPTTVAYHGTLLATKLRQPPQLTAIRLFILILHY